MTFRSDLDAAYNKKVVQAVDKKVRTAALVVDAELAVTTPVDTGRARANWLPSLNVPSSKTVEPGGKEEINTALNSFKIGDTVFITNNLPYIRRLNEGYSKQAPAGFVDSAILKAVRAVKK